MRIARMAVACWRILALATREAVASCLIRTLACKVFVPVTASLTRAISVLVARTCSKNLTVSVLFTCVLRFVRAERGRGIYLVCDAEAISVSVAVKESNDTVAALTAPLLFAYNPNLPAPLIGVLSVAVYIQPPGSLPPSAHQFAVIVEPTMRACSQ